MDILKAFKGKGKGEGGWYNFDFYKVYGVRTKDYESKVEQIFESKKEATIACAKKNTELLNNKTLIQSDDFYEVATFQYISTPINNESLDVSNIRSMYWITINFSNLGKGNNFNSSYLFSFQTLINENEPINLNLKEDYYIHSDNFPIFYIFAIRKDLLHTITNKVITHFLYEYSQLIDLSKIDLVDIEDLKQPMDTFANSFVID